MVQGWGSILAGAGNPTVDMKLGVSDPNTAEDCASPGVQDRLWHGSVDRSSPGPDENLKTTQQSDLKRARDDSREEGSQKISKSTDELDRESQGNDDDPYSSNNLSREAEVFALQAIHTALLKKLSDIGPILSTITKENRLYRKVLEDMGRSREEIKRLIEAEIMRSARLNPPPVATPVDAAVIVAATLGRNLNSPVDAMHDVLKLYRYCPPSTPQRTDTAASV
mmetsp:Transcript_8512/g.24416  ORF Transcript_8512/g.24416 Transcript_8512/m.24416 type:complete len:224 (-) Transcript_8512:145-816(-)